jgi:protein arginine kinase activator
MKCDICKKKEASIYITEIINDEKKTLHLCFDCATNLGIKGILKELNIPYDENIIKKFLSLMPGFIELDEKEKVCEKCGTKFEDFKKTGFLGCSNCYETFKDELRPIILNLHGSMKHSGKRKGEKFTPKTSIDEKVKKLKKELEYAIEEERYEDAAKIRDKINELLNNVKNNT